MRFHNRFKDYLRVSSIGILIGVLAQLICHQSFDNLWSLPSLATMYGFWVVAACFLIWRSSSHIAAGLHVLFFLFFTTLSYYGIPFLMGFVFPYFYGTIFPVSTFLYNCLSIFICGIAAIVLYCWNHHKWYNAILLALPIGLLTAESLHVLSLLHTQQTHLLQLLFNAGFGMYFGLQFRKMAHNKEIYTVTVIAVTWLTNRYII